MTAINTFRYVLGAIALNIVFGQTTSVSTGSTTTTTTTPGTTISYQYKFVQKKGFACQSQSGLGTNLAIGEDDRTFDVGVNLTVAYCQDKCSKHDRCQGFDYQDADASDAQPPVCRYKGNIDSDTLTVQPETTCYIYLRPNVVTLTTAAPTTAMRSTCSKPNGCFGGSCDSHILDNPALNCEHLEKIHCDCTKCQCEAVTSTSTTTPKAGGSTKPAFKFKFKWTEVKNSDCVSTMGSALAIGEGVSDDGWRKTYDHWTVENCKEKCAQDLACVGFNYDKDLNVCRYKSSLSHAKAIPKDTHDCWVYDRDNVVPTIPAGSTLPPRTTTTTSTTSSTFEFIWVKEENEDCASHKLTSNLHIGDTLSPMGNKRSYDVEAVDYCMDKCARYVKCDGFNYEYEMGLCRYKTGITHAQLIHDENHACFVYLWNASHTPKPETSSTSTTTTIAPLTVPGDTCNNKGSCLHASCDHNIAAKPDLTCEVLELLGGCDCSGCQCKKTVTTTRTYQYNWNMYPKVACSSVMGTYPKGTQLKIGQDGAPMDEGFSVDDCKNVCAQEELCVGFNYEKDANAGTCRYHARPAGGATTNQPFRDADDITCYIYDRPTTTSTTTTTTSTTTTTTTTTPTTTTAAPTPTTAAPTPTTAAPIDTTTILATASTVAATSPKDDGLEDTANTRPTRPPASGKGTDNTPPAAPVGSIVGVVVGALLTIGAIVGVVVGVTVYKNTQKPRGYSQTYHNANNLETGGDDL